MSNNEASISTDGWTAVPRAQSKVLSNVDANAPAKFVVDDIKLPDSEVVKKTYEYAKEKLPEQTFNHSMRVYYYGMWTSLLSSRPMTSLVIN